MTKQRGQKHDQLVDILLDPVLRTQREHQCECEQADGVFDDVVSQQRRSDNSRGQLRAGDLNRHEQRTECEDHEGKRCRDDGLQHGLCAWHSEAHEVSIRARRQASAISASLPN